MKSNICKECRKIFLSPQERGFCSSRCYSKYINKNKIFDLKCNICLRMFQGRRNEKLCCDCKGKRKVKQFKEKFLYCPNCRKNIVGVRKVQTLHKEILYSRKMCGNCKEKSKKSIIDHMRSDKNPQIQKHGRAKNKIRMTKKEVSNTNSIRMKKNNPMKNPNVVKKVVETRKITYKRGSEHHLWKGNRDRAQTIRARLYKPWVLKQMEKSHWMCDLCKREKIKLEVHHINPLFRDLINSFLKNGEKLNKVSEERFEEISALIEAKHLNGCVISITLCVDCHKFVDSLRR